MIFKQLSGLINIIEHHFLQCKDITGPSRQAPSLTFTDAIYCKRVYSALFIIRLYLLF